MSTPQRRPSGRANSTLIPRPAAQCRTVQRRTLLRLALTAAALSALTLSTSLVFAQTRAATGAAMPAAAAMSPVPSAAPSQEQAAAAPSPDGKSVAAKPAAPADEAPLLDEGPPTRVRVAILNASGKTGGANTVALLLGDYKRRVLEDQIGLQIEIVNLSTADIVRQGKTIIYYRTEFLRAALIMAKAIPGEQYVAPMRSQELKKAGMDVEIVVGSELP